MRPRDPHDGSPITSLFTLTKELAMTSLLDQMVPPAFPDLDRFDQARCHVLQYRRHIRHRDQSPVLVLLPDGGRSVCMHHP